MLNGIVILLFLALLGGWIAKSFKQPLMTGYLAAGFAGGLAIASRLNMDNTLPQIMDIGIILLLFSVGLELNMAKIVRVKKIVFWGALIQMACTIIIVWLFTRDLLVASAFSLSSTALVLKILSDRAELDSLHGEILTGWMIIQDLAVVPMLLFIEYGKSSTLGPALILVLIKSFLLIYCTLIFGRKVIPYLFRKTSAIKSREMMFLLTALVIFGTAAISSLLGLSLALGAFLAGLVVSQTIFRHEVFAETRPFRDISLVIFFLGMGVVFSTKIFAMNFINIFLLAGVVFAVKFTVTFIIVRLFNYHPKTAFYVALGVANVGEFAFILSQYSHNSGYQAIIGVTVLSLLIGPLLLKTAPKLWHFTVLRKILSKGKYPPLNENLLGNNENQPKVVLIGFGRVGKGIGRTLALANIPYAVIEFDGKLAEEIRVLGIPVIYGDPMEIEILEKAGVAEARVVIIAIPDRYYIEQIIANCHQLNKEARVIVRAHFAEDKLGFLAAGAYHIVTPEFEGGLSIAHKTLTILGFNQTEVGGLLKKVRHEEKI